jgi:hypothetical protein
MNDKKTAVEWLFNELCSEKLSWNKDSNGTIFFDKITSDILQQAKEMEKEQNYKIRQLLIKGALTNMSFASAIVEFDKLTTR